MELSLQARKERLLRMLSPETTFLDESTIDPHSDPEDTPHLITLHDVHELLQQRQAVERREQRASGRSRNPDFFTPPSTGDLDIAMADRLVKQEYPEFEDMKPGDMSDPEMTFVLWDNVQQYPQHYIGKANVVKSAQEFENKLDSVIWDFHYLYNPRESSLNASLLVPTKQFVRFLGVVNARLGIRLTIPEGIPGDKFRVQFGVGGTPCPRYLGRSTRRRDFEAVSNAIPPADEVDLCKRASPIGIDELAQKLNVVNISKAGKKKQKSQKRQREAKERQLDSLQHVQRCLGIRGADRSLIGPDGKVLRLNIWNTMPYKRHSDVVFAAIDIEVAEQSPSTILEIGISILDTLEVVTSPPGENASNWFRVIKSHHLLTYETRFTRNHKFVHGCPDAYDFGQSELIKRARLKARVLEILTEFSQLQVDDPALKGQRRFRPIVLVGHDIASDINYLNSMDTDIGDIPGFSCTADTKDMHQLWRESSIGRSLGNILDDLLIPHTHLHNAGNDATYTLQAMLALALRARLSELHKKQDLEHTLDEQSRLSPAHVDAKAASQETSVESSREWASRYHAGNECW